MKIRGVGRMNWLTVFGLCVLAIANTGHMLVVRHTFVPERITDPVYGFVYGVGIASALLGIRRQRRGINGQGRCA